MKVYVFGNEDLKEDNVAIIVSKKLKGKIKNIDFITVNVNEDLPFKDGEDVVILDTVIGISRATKLEDKDLDNLVLNKSLTAHDYDLGFQIKYLKKLGKLGKVTVVGLPLEGEIDYFLIQSILRKLVEQDMQGS